MKKLTLFVIVTALFATVTSAQSGGIIGEYVLKKDLETVRKAN
jgi:hypothetical protein